MEIVDSEYRMSVAPVSQIAAVQVHGAAVCLWLAADLVHASNWHRMTPCSESARKYEARDGAGKKFCGPSSPCRGTWHRDIKSSIVPYPNPRNIYFVQCILLSSTALQQHS